MSAARAHLPGQRAVSTVAALSVASTVGIGVGYPLVGLLDQVAGLRAAYGLGLVLSAAALALAWAALPAEDPGRTPRLDWPGTALLGLGTLGALLLVAEPAVWTPPAVGACILGATVLLLAAWAVVELRSRAPLVDLRLLGRSSVLRANVAMAFAGVGMYLLFSLLTRFLQTPPDASYGFGLPGVVAGAALVPFSALGFVAGRVAPRVAARLTDRRAYVASSVAVALAAVVFALGTGSLVAVLAAMAVLGLGVGGVSAVMPALVLTGVPRAETASVLTVNQIVRSLGFSTGSAVAGLLLAVHTPAGDLVPTLDGYATAALWALVPVALGAVAAPVTRRTRRPARR